MYKRQGQSLTNNADSNGPLRGVKRDAWDGGTRVPFMVRWPGQAAAGLKVSTPVWHGDIFATIAAFLGSELSDSTCPDGESFLNLLRGQQKPEQRRAIVMSSFEGHLGLKTNDGWKFIDSTGGGGNTTSWDSSNIRIDSPRGVDQGIPKQLFHQAIDLGEDFNLISGFLDDGVIRQEITSRVGEDLLGLWMIYAPVIRQICFREFLITTATPNRTPRNWLMDRTRTFETSCLETLILMARSTF